MCLAIPGKVEQINPESNDDFKSGIVVFGSIRNEVNFSLVPEVKVGDYVLVHVGVAISIVDEEEAHKTFKYVKEMGELDDLENNGL